MSSLPVLSERGWDATQQTPPNVTPCRRRLHSILIFLTISVVTIMRIVLFDETFSVLKRQSTVDIDDSLLGRRSRQSRLIVLSLDGFRHDYLRFLPIDSFLQKLARKGVHIESLEPCFPSMTFPNHYSMATGLLPESHGIVDNIFYDDTDHTNFSYQNMQLSKWWGGEPLWVTAEIQGRRTYADSWPGTDVEIRGVRPSRFEVYNGSTPLESRIVNMVSWANDKVSPPSLIMGYIQQPDAAGTWFGPDSKQTQTMVASVDKLVGSLIQSIDLSAINLMIVSDHGMMTMDTVIDLDPFLDFSDLGPFRITFHSPIVHFYPDDDLIPVLLQKLHSLHDQHPAVSVYLREEIPDRFLYRDNVRIGKVVIIADPGVELTSSKLGHGSALNKGNHGFDNAHPDMAGIMIAAGPAFQNHVVIPQMRNLNVYEIACHVLGIAAAANNGSVEFHKTIFKTSVAEA